MSTVVANLMVANVQESVAFYRDVLGFEVIARVPVEGEVLGSGEPDQDLVFASLKRGTGELMLQSAESFSAEAPGVEPDNKPSATASIYLRVDNLAELQDNLGDSITKPPKISWYGMNEIWALDPDGYLLTIGERMANADPESD